MKCSQQSMNFVQFCYKLYFKSITCLFSPSTGTILSPKDRLDWPLCQWWHLDPGRPHLLNDESKWYQRLDFTSWGKWHPRVLQKLKLIMIIMSAFPRKNFLEQILFETWVWESFWNTAALEKRHSIYMKWLIGNMHKYYWDLKPGMEFDFSFQMLPVKFWKIACSYLLVGMLTIFVDNHTKCSCKAAGVYIYICIYVRMYIYICYTQKIDSQYIAFYIHLASWLLPVSQLEICFIHFTCLLLQKLWGNNSKQMRHPGFYRSKLGHSGSFFDGEEFHNFGNWPLLSLEFPCPTPPSPLE